MRALFAAALTFSAAGVEAAPLLTINDQYSNNAWVNPALCASPACPAVTALTGPPAGFQLIRTNTAPTAIADTQAESFDNGVLGVLANGNGVLGIMSNARYLDTRTFTGPSTPAYIVPFQIAAFEISVGPGGALGDVRQAIGGFSIKVNTVTVGNLVAIATLDVNNSPAGESILAPVASGFTLPAGFTTFAGIGTIPDGIVETYGPGGTIQVNLGAFITGQVFTIDYTMFASILGTGAGRSTAFIGDPFAFREGPGIDFLGLSVPFAPVPAPAALALFGLALIGLACHRSRTMQPQRGSPGA